MQLRAYQADLAKRAAKVLEESKSVVVQLETGAGKTHIAAAMCRAWVRQKKRVWFIAHRQEIIAQAQRVFDEAGIAHGPGKRVEFRMIAAAAKASREQPAPDVLIFDECHHAPAKTWAGVIKSAPKAARLGLTATPGRLDGAPLSDFFAEIVQGPSPRELREAGHLARYRYFAPVVPDLSDVKVRKGEYDRSQAVAVMTGSAIVGDVVEHYRRHADGKRAILFAVSIEASRDMAARFNAAGVPALHIDGETPDDERAAAVAAVRRGKVKILCNVDLFTEGFDLPAIDAVILLRPTRSLALFRQMLGRGARPSGRSRTVILDHAACVVEHGLPDEDYAWTLDGSPPRRKREIEGGERVRMRRCPECNAVHEWAGQCPECGHEYAGREVAEIGGRLAEIERPPGYLTPREYAARLGKKSEYVLQNIRRGAPALNGYVDPVAFEKWQADRREQRLEKLRARARTPEARERTRLACHTPAAKAKRTRAFQSPETKKKMSIAFKARIQKEENLARQSEIAKKRWLSEQQREEAKIRGKTDHRIKGALDKGRSSRWSDPTSRLTAAEKMRRIWKLRKPK